MKEPQHENNSLYNIGESDTTIPLPLLPEKIHCTLTVDTLIFSFPYNPDVERSLLDKTFKLNGYKYKVHNNSTNQIFSKRAEFEYKKSSLGTLLFSKNSRSKFPKMNRLDFRVSKECFYGSKDWIKPVEALFKELNISEYSIKRLDIALDIGWSMLDAYQDMRFTHLWSITSKSPSKPSFVFCEGSKQICGLRIKVDENKRIISVYRKGDSAQLLKHEQVDTPESYKKISQYQKDYWTKNKLDINTVERIEIRLQSKYANKIEWRKLNSKSVLLSTFKHHLGKHFVFRDNKSHHKNVSRRPKFNCLPIDRVLINEQTVKARNIYQFRLPIDVAERLKATYYTSKLKVVKSLSNNCGYVDIGDNLMVKVVVFPKGTPHRRCSFDNQFTEKQFYSTNRFPEYDDFTITDEEWQKIDQDLQKCIEEYNASNGTI